MMQMAAIFGVHCLLAFIRPACSENIDYTITIKTADRANAGTDADVFINIFGSYGSTGRKVLPDQTAGHFERGDVDTFVLHTKNVGRIRAIEIGHNNRGHKAGWFLDYVEIVQKVAAVFDFNIRPGTTKYRFDFYGWIANDEGDGQLAKTIYTSFPQVNLG
ncbi:lipoxygenase homology domain-containing protein 1-like [Physella acuta]|uniref:lipoxygenase homology domain-containing protein 1-like n=1 Tax=Physella acuta TaxID=109671 RepID=UPI0027DE35AA|nr:lipoxygenase homology domain-containing protein 1-like [Physella acuta]